jgi:hypothetical protein
MREAIVVLTSATGSVGGRFLRALEEAAVVRCLARNPYKVMTAQPTTTVAEDHCLDESRSIARDGVDTASLRPLHGGGVHASLIWTAPAVRNIGRADGQCDYSVFRLFDVRVSCERTIR